MFGLFQQFGLMGGGNQGFTQTYRCRSVAFHKPDMENGGKSAPPRIAFTSNTIANTQSVCHLAHCTC